MSIRISGLFGSRIREQVLSYFFNNKKQYYLRELAAALSVSPGALQRELKNLCNLNIINLKKENNRTYYYLNPENILYNELESIFKKKGSYVKKINDLLKAFKTQVEIAFLYGSYVKGNELADSDIDLFIIGEISLLDIAEKIKKIEQSLNKEINPFIISKKDLKNKYDNKNHFILSIIKEKKIFLIGDENEIQRIIK